MMKKFIFMATLLLYGIVCYASTGLRVIPRTGEAVIFMFEEQPEVTFLAGKLQIKTTSQVSPTGFDLDDIESIDFTTPSKIDNAATDACIHISADNAGVHFTNVPADATAAIYDMGGACVTTTKVNDGTYHILRSDIATGVYVVKINEFVTKIAL